MNHWPKSLPDYQWPESYQSTSMRSLRSILSGAFHASHAVGRLIGELSQRVSGKKNLPTLVIRTDGIGDALLFEPALETLARSSSPSEIHLWAPKSTCQLFSECPTITHRMEILRGGKAGNIGYFSSLSQHIKFGFELGRWTFQRVVYPAQSPEPFGNWLFESARASERWINFGDTDNQLDWQQKKSHERATRVLESRPGSAHELMRNEYLSDQWSEQSRLRRPRVHLNQRAIESASRLISSWRRTGERQGAEGLIGVVVGSASSAKRYPADQWAEVITRLWEDQRLAAVLLGGADDREMIEAVDQCIESIPHFRLTRTMNLLAISAVIRRLDGVIAIDTGMAHIALSMNVPTVVLVGGGHPGRFFPWPGNARQVVLNVPMACEGCKNRCHLEDPHCITRIRSDEIADAMANLRSHGSVIESMTLSMIETRSKRMAG